MLVQGKRAGVTTGQIGPLAIMSGAQLCAKFASNESLRLVSYPVQALAKSSKTIPAMLGAVFSGKKFTVVQWLCALGITGGTAAFTYLGKSSKAKDTALLGVLLLVASLFFDGAVAAVQVSLKSKGKGTPPSAFELMAFTNIGAMIWSAPYAQYTGSLMRGYEYTLANPAFLKVLGTLAVCSAFGQAFIFLTISWFGPDTCAKITTVRKMMTVLTSIFVYNHSVAKEQWFAVMVVFGSVLTELVTAMAGKKEEKEKKKK